MMLVVVPMRSSSHYQIKGVGTQSGSQLENKLNPQNVKFPNYLLVVSKRGRFKYVVIARKSNIYQQANNVYEGIIPVFAFKANQAAMIKKCSPLICSPTISYYTISTC